MNKSDIKTNWNLSPLFKSVNDPEIKNQRFKAKNETEKFVKKWQHRNDYLEDPKTLVKALKDYERWQQNIGPNSWENYFFSLKTSLDQNNPQLKAKEILTTELAHKLQNDIQFFEMRIAKIHPKLHKKFLKYSNLAKYRHFLEKLFEQSKYLLSEPEEKIMKLKSTTSYTNWVKMLNGFLSKEESEVINEKNRKIKTNLSDLLGLMNSQNKKVRDSAALAFNIILGKNADVAEHELNSVLLNKKINDDLRGYNRPDKARHVADDIETEVVDTLINSVSKDFSIPKRYYKLKAKLMKVPKLDYHERNVEYGKIDNKYSFKTGVDILLNVFNNLDREFGEIFKKFVEEGRLDVYPKKNKASGAFCTHGLLVHPTYSLLNWTNKLNDVLTLAHEMGHGINFELVKKRQSALNFGTTVATTEVASTFMEDFVLQELIINANDEMKLSILMMKLNDDISTIFRQIAFYNFELELHKNLRKTGYLSKEQIGKLFQKHMVSYMGNAVKQSEGSQNWWVYVNHFRYFFYVYSYASGQLISKSLQASVKENPQFIDKVKTFLSSGLSESPKNIFAKLGIDITDKNFWNKGIGEVDKLLIKTEDLAKKLGRL